MDIPEKIYDAFMMPLEVIRLRQLRNKLLRRATGKVLELGAGTGVNFRHYPRRQVSSLTVMDLSLSKRLRRIAPKRVQRVRMMPGNVMHMPFKKDAFDTIVFTLLFCSVEDPLKGLEEVKRVLRPGGKVLFIEHVLPDRHCLAGAFHFLNPYWLKVSKSCHINRETLKTIEAAGFSLVRVERHLRGSVVCGIARPL